MKKKKLFRKIALYFALFIFVVLFFASSIARSYVQKNGESLVGRKVQIGKLHLNYLSISVKIEDFVLFEENKVDTFVSFKQLHINAQPWQMLKNEYALKKFLLDGLFVNIEQNGNTFNFDDLIPDVDSSAVDTSSVENEESARFSFKNISIQNSNFNYLDKEVDNLISLHNLNLQLPLLAWNNEQSEVGVDFKIGEKGHLHISADVNNENDTYAVQAQIDSLDLNPFSIYLKPYLNTSELQGFLSSNITAKGSMIDYMNVIFSGHAGIYDFILPNAEGTPVFSSKKFYIDLDSIDMLNQYYGINTIELGNPQLWVEDGKESSNIEQLFAPITTTDSTAPTDSTSAAEAEADTTPIFYRVDSILISKGELNYVDASLNRPFKYNLSSIDLGIGQITEAAEYIPLSIGMILNDKGSFKGRAGLNMLSPENVTFNGAISNLELSSFSPYSEYFIAHPITRGELNYKVDVEMTATELNNLNDIRISKLEFGDKTPDTTALKTPIRLALYILKDKNDNIAFEVPVWGNPSDPDFSIGKIVWKTFSNFTIKIATEPFSALANLVGTKPESIQQINFALTQDSLSVDQRNTLDKLGEILESKPQFIFTLTQETPSQIEQNELAVKQIIVDYLLKTQPANTPSDSLKLINSWNTIDRNDSEFIEYVQKRYALSDSLSVEHKCLTLIGKENAASQLTNLLKHRNKIIQDYLTEELKVSNTNIVVQTADLVNMRVQSETPVYQIEVSMQ